MAGVGVQGWFGVLGGGWGGEGVEGRTSGGWAGLALVSPGPRGGEGCRAACSSEWRVVGVVGVAEREWERVRWLSVAGRGFSGGHQGGPGRCRCGRQ